MKKYNKLEEIENMERGNDYKTIGEILIITGVMMYIVSVFALLILPFNDSLNLFIFGLFIASATGMVIYGGFQLSYYHKLNNKEEELDDILNGDFKQAKSKKDKINEKKRKESISSIFSMIATGSYLYIGFFYGLWHPGWLIFLLIPVVNALYDLLRARDSSSM